MIAFLKNTLCSRSMTKEMHFLFIDFYLNTIFGDFIHKHCIYTTSAPSFPLQLLLYAPSDMTFPLIITVSYIYIYAPSNMTFSLIITVSYMCIYTYTYLYIYRYIWRLLFHFKATKT